jgi:hypothetical protein
MNRPNSSRRDFLKASTLAALGASAARISTTDALARDTVSEPVTLPSGIVIKGDVGVTRPRPSGQKPVHDLTTQPLEKVRVGIIGLHRGMSHVDACLKIDCCEIVAVCDVFDDRAKHAASECEKAGAKSPAIYSGTEHIWEKMIERDDIDAVYVATPWDWHVPMSVRAMEHGKHALVEVAAAVTVDDCWKLVDTSERTRRHCVLLENCCYGENEMFVLNMAREGVFGDLTHAECAYLHDLRQMLFSLGTEGDWRRNYHWKYDGNLYPTHGLGPVAQYLGVGRGDQFKYLVSVSSPEKSLTQYRNEAKPNGGRHANEKYICGDMNTSLLKTVLGRTIMVQHDVVSPRPYSRINALYGTGATFFDFPARLAIDKPKQYGLNAGGSEGWLDDADMRIMREKFTHPLWRKLRQQAEGAGHGGMDFIINWNLINCIHKGQTPDSVVYDAAAWSSIIELSSRSVAAGSAPVAIPDFTRGIWRSLHPLGIVGKEPLES